MRRAHPCVVLGSKRWCAQHQRLLHPSYLSHLSYTRGFTLVELVVTLIVVGILASVAVPRLMGRQGFESRGYFDAAVGALRYAQKLAISQRRNVFAGVTATTVTLCYSSTFPCAGANQVLDPVTGSTGFTVDAQRGDPVITPAITVTPATVFGFNPLGQPITAAGAVQGASLIFNFAPVEVGDVVRELTVEQQTGYVRQTL